MMVNGLVKFKEHFKSFQNEYVLIGGSACDLLMEEADLPFRATKDLDLVLCVEALNDNFVNHFWQFVQSGQYDIMERGNGDKCFYRFTKPKDKTFPYMLEILSRKSDVLGERVPGTIAPLTINEEIISLSAILLDDTYYSFIKDMKVEIDEVSLVDQRCLIPLKARAWIDLSERKKSGDSHAKGDDIKKHKNDVYRLSQLLIDSPLENVPEKIKEDIIKFTSGVRSDVINLRQIGIDGTVEDICALLLRVYC